MLLLLRLLTWLSLFRKEDHRPHGRHYGAVGPAGACQGGAEQV